MPTPRFGVPTRLLASLAFGTVLNPLNSSMIAVALVPLQREFGVGVATSSWLVSGFYLAAAVGQPLMGRLVDLLGARRLFVGGLALMCAVCAAAPFAPGFWWLVGIGVLMAVGTSTAFPAALVLIRTAVESGDRVAGQKSAGSPGNGSRPPSAALAALTVAASTSAALGPVLGGFLVAFAGWQAVFLVNVPFTAAGILLAVRLLPRPPAHSAGSEPFLRTVDLPGLLLFSATLTGLLVFLLSLADRPQWWLVPAVVVLAAVLVRQELAAPAPFLDIRGLVANRALSSVLGQQCGVNLVFYCVFFGLPLWLGSVRGFGSDTVGLLILPLALMGVLMTPVAARVVSLRGSRATLVFGSAVLLAGTLVVQLLHASSPMIVIVVAALLFGIPGGFNNLGLQTALYEASPPERMGSSGGLFQTFRYLGAILSTSVLGIVFERDLSTRGLHHVGWLMTAVAAVLLLLALARHSGRRRHVGSGDTMSIADGEAT
ncbi:MFS transporter [Actinopolymorpha rutila]|uniref:MFS family permease n=1 Tax=Actinopolymorpha rutila TaxID=446787 RepID=A0A852ZAZ9_9ACTN|nr:MFS family permease [Actinopolymorpha rutila]